MRHNVDLKSIAIEGGLVGGPFGSSLGGKDYVSYGVPVIRGMNLGVGRYIGGDYAYVTEEKVESNLKRNTAKPGDIIFTQRGTLGQVALVPKSKFETLVISQSQMRLRVAPAIASAEYVYYACRDSKFLQQVSDNAISTGVPHINLGILSRLRIPLPNMTQQRAIAEVLGALDDKIAANTKLADMSFELARLIFVESKQRAAKKVSIGSIAVTVLGGTPSRAVPEYWSGGKVPWLNSGKANEDRIMTPSELITEEALARSAAKLMPAGSTVIAITGATLGQVSRLEIDASGNQSLVGVWSEDPALNDWLHFSIHDNVPELLKKATGAAQQHVNKRDVDSLVIQVLSGDDLAVFHSRVSPLLSVAANADRETLTLAAVRDTVLPELMSERLRVKDAEKKVGEVV